MKNKKLRLSQIKVKSFVTDVENEKSETVKGKGFSDGTICNSMEPEFCNWTKNQWCVSNGYCHTYEFFCTAPK